MNIPKELKYTADDEWLKMLDDGSALVGITDYAQDQLSDVVFVTLPEEGDEVVAGEAFGDVESVKAVSDLISPVSGTVAEVNHDLEDSPELLNSDPYGTFIIRVENVTDYADLLDADAYREKIGEE